MLPALPSGTVTFLFADVPDAAALWNARSEELRETLPALEAALGEAVHAAGGRVFKTVSGGVCAAFAEAWSAVAAAVAAALAAREAAPDLLVRAALHTGAAEERDGDYFGPPLNRAARLLALAHPGQVLVSLATQALAADRLPPGTALRALGSHRLKDLSRPETVFQVVHDGLASEFPPLRSLDTQPHNLPVQLTSFIGRERELAAVRDLVGRGRLVTLTGPGGTGKTRLSLQAAADLLEQFPDGAWLVELAPLSDPDLVPAAVAAAAGVREQAVKPLRAVLAAELSGKRLLLILDNCEHLVDACAALADELLRAGPEIRILATSREPLNVGGERLLPVPTLGLPPDRPAAAELEQWDSARLFVERAREVASGFTVTDWNAPWVARVCRRLDGIPLALELAAARARVLSPEEIAERLDDRFRLLTRGSRTALPRQQTLRALIDWSHDLLSPPERVLFRRLAVFAGGWSLKAAEQVGACGPPDGGRLEGDEVLDLLGSLVDRSLVLFEDRGAAGRYRMLETVREYALQRLRDADEEPEARAAHLAWSTGLAREAEGALNGPGQGAWLARLEEEHDNFRAALRWALGPGAARAGDSGARLAGALARFWEIRGYLSEGREWIAAALPLPGAAVPEETVAAVRYGAGVLCFRQGEYADAREHMERALAAYRAVGDRAGEAAALGNLANLAQVRQEFAEAAALYEQTLALARETGNRDREARTLFNLGILMARQGELDRTWELVQEARRLHEAVGNRAGLLYALNSLGTTARARGDLDGARGLMLESLALCRELGDRLNASFTLANLGALAEEAGDAERAVRLHAAADSLRRSIGATLMPGQREAFLADHDRLREKVRPERFQAAWQEGAALEFEDAVDYARGEAVPEP